MTDSLRSKILLYARRNFVLLFLALGLISSCVPKEVKIFKNQNVGGALGTSYSLIYLSEQELDYQVQIDSVFEVINRSLSTYIPDSDISKINRADTSLVVDHMFRDVFELSKEIHRETSGYFDPTVGTLVNAWGFGPGEQIALDSAKVDSLLQYVGFEKVALKADGRIEKQRKKIYFDFNAIAKGYAIDRLGKMLDQKGIENYLLEVGGELVAKGENILRQKQWAVGIDDPQVEIGRVSKMAIRLRNQALASSGNYRKFRVDSLTGKKYVHTIDPKTGFTKNSNTLAVTVLAKNCATADGYATAFMAMSLAEVQEYLAKQEALEAYIIYLDDTGESQEFMTEGFEKSVLK